MMVACHRVFAAEAAGGMGWPSREVKPAQKPKRVGSERRAESWLDRRGEVFGKVRVYSVCYIRCQSINIGSSNTSRHE